MSLYLDHLATLQRHAESALERTGFDTLLIAAGIEKYAFLDDRPYLFQANPHFKHWLPLANHPHSWLAVRPGRKPRVVYFQPDDYWHVPPSPPSGEWVDAVELVVIREPEQAAPALADCVTPRTAIVAEADAGLPGLVPNNPEALLNLLHWARGVKTPYELAQMRAAQRRAVPAHLAARQAFLAGASEAAIHRAYLVASGHTDRDLPYGNIVGLNEHAAVLHYQYQDESPPAESRSFLIDAGAQVNGYASDITRTWAAPGHDEFAALVAAMEAEQLGLVDEVREGVDYRDIHLSAHRRTARVLRGAGLVNMGEEAMVEEGVTKPFFPHGIGHLLGLQVHDVGGFMASEAGGVADKPEGHRYLRLTRPLQAGMVVTIEPGLYFIPMLLRELRASRHAGQVDWDAVDRLARYGGIRIEDDVACRAAGEAPENLTRDAFAGGLMGIAASLLAGALALPASAPQPEAQLGRVEVQGEAATAREQKTLAQIFKAEALFLKHRALAPEAALTFKVYARTRAEAAQRLELALVTPAGRQPVALDAQDRFVIDPAWRGLDPAIQLRSRLVDGRVTWRPDIRTPGVPGSERRLGDLRLQCRVGFGSGVARGATGFGRLLSFAFDDCWDRDWSPSNFADAPVFGVTLVHGERRLTVSARLLHGLRDDGGADFDWGFSLRERMFRLPLGDESWPDDTRVVFEAMDDPPAPPDPRLQALKDDWVRAALALEPGLAPAEVAQRLGAPGDDTRFESGRRLQRHLREVPAPGGPLRLELVSLFDAGDRLLKTSLRRQAPGRRD